MELTCSQPPALTEDQISAALDGETGQPEIQQHLERCAACRHRLDQARQVERMLRTRKHPSAQELGDYHLGLLDPATQTAIESHLAHCTQCQSEIENLRAFLADEPVTARPRRAQPEAPRLSGLGTLLARLVPNSPALAFRGGAQSEPLVLTAGDITVFLETQPGHNGSTLVGQIEAAEQILWIGALVILRQTNDVVLTAVVDDMAQFRCGPLQTGLVALRITSAGGQMLVLDGVDLNQSR